MVRLLVYGGIGAYVALICTNQVNVAADFEAAVTYAQEVITWSHSLLG